jgi:hypothetical protein
MEERRMDPGLFNPSLEERIREARAQRSIAVGEAIGDALHALWRVLSSFDRVRLGGVPEVGALERGVRGELGRRA